MATIKTIADLPVRTINAEGARDCSARIIFGPRDHAPTFALREFTLAPQGHTPYHQHSWEHEVVLLDHPLTLVSDTGDTTLLPGQAVLVPPGEMHRFRNDNPHPVRFLCLVPVEHQP